MAESADGEPAVGESASGRGGAERVGAQRAGAGVSGRVAAPPAAGGAADVSTARAAREACAAREAGAAHEGILRRQSARESAARTYARALPIVPARARGLTIEGADGRRYLDCLSGAGTLALGHNHPVALAQEFPCIGDVRGRGLMIGVEMVNAEADDSPPPAAPELAAAVQRECLKSGLIIELGGRHTSVVRLLPPLTITDEQVSAVLDRLADAIGAVACGQAERLIPVHER